VVDAIAANGVQIDPTIFTNPSWSIGASMFINGIDTETKGVDLVVSYASDFGAFGSVDWTFSGNYTDQHVTSIAPPPAALLVGATGPEPALFSSSTAYNFENASPTFRFHLGARWAVGAYTVSLTETINGPARNIAQSPQTAAWYATELDTTFVTDLEISYDVNDAVRVSIGADNLLNEYPPMVPDWVRQEQLNLNSNAYATKYSTLSPYGINGGYYYGRLTYSF
jgi:iron complex outermembrane receptor protein